MNPYFGCFVLGVIALVLLALWRGCEKDNEGLRLAIDADDGSMLGEVESRVWSIQYTNGKWRVGTYGLWIYDDHLARAFKRAVAMGRAADMADKDDV